MISMEEIVDLYQKGKYIAELNQIKVKQAYMFCFGNPNSNYRITFPSGIILEKYNEKNERMNSIMKSIKANIPCGYVGNPFVRVDRFRSIPRLIFNK